ncbi:MAG: hypothetical protein RMJ56_13655 [Gemmataceae bacterium]|nr:hypothetical protein [Gemmata sp.]MDW8198637.1 hypothetical protein [Gemmataceae bacterium]
MSRAMVWMIAFLGFVGGVVLVVSFDARDARAQPKAPAVVAAPQAPTLTTLAHLGAKPGTEVELTLTGTNLAGPTAILLNAPATVSIPSDNKNGTDAGQLRVKVKVDEKCPIGLYSLRVATQQGISNARPFVVDVLPPVASRGNNRTKATAQAVTIPCVVSGTIANETSDFYQLKVAANQRLTFEVLARRIGSPLDPIIVLHDAKTQRELIELYADDTPGLQGDCRLTHTFREAGEILVEVRDTTYRGGADFAYRLRIGDFPAATTAFPLAISADKPATVGFAGPDQLPPIPVTPPRGLETTAIPVIPRREPQGLPGWPVLVRISEWPELTEQEPNDQPDQANPLPVPGGVSAKFDKPKDVDHFRIRAKKGEKLVVNVLTYEVNSPAEVFVRVLDAKGMPVATSNPAAANNRFEFTPAADGDYVLACEHLNYLHGPHEIYHLAITPARADFTLALALDRYEAIAGGGTAVMATVNRLNGFTGPVELSVFDNDNVVSGSVTLPAGQTFTFLPLTVKDGTKPGGYSFWVKGRAVVDGAEIVRLGSYVDLAKANWGGMPNPPWNLISECAVAVLAQPPLTLTLAAQPLVVEKGKASQVTITATRDTGADGDITLTPLYLPPNITAAAKPLAKGQTKAEFPLTVAGNAAVGPSPVVFRATTKIAGKDYAITPPPVLLEVVEPKKAEPKNDEPKKEKK